MKSLTIGYSHYCAFSRFYFHTNLEEQSAEKQAQLIAEIDFLLSINPFTATLEKSKK